jgi:hypothetical protein
VATVGTLSYTALSGSLPRVGRARTSRILRRLVARYDPDIVSIHGDEPGVDGSFAAAAKEPGVTAEPRGIEAYTDLVLDLTNWYESGTSLQ